MTVTAKSLFEFAALAKGRVQGNGDAEVRRAAPVEEAGQGDIAFVTDKKRLKAIKAGTSAAFIVGEDIAGDEALKGLNLIVVKNPYLAFAKALEVLRPVRHPAPGVHPSAVVHPGAALAGGVSIGACVVVEDGACVGDKAVLYPGVYVGKDASIGEGSVLYPGVVVRERCIIGKRVIIHSNAVIGSDGFGYARDGNKYYKIPQTGIVRIEDDVELGAAVTVDRATLGETVVGRGTKIDNLVQIGHNVRVGEDVVIVAQVGVAGSTVIGSRVQIGGQAGIVGHLNIGDGAMIAAQSGVISDVDGAAVVSGTPAISRGDWLRASNVFAKLPEMKKRLIELEKKVKELEARSATVE